MVPIAPDPADWEKTVPQQQDNPKRGTDANRNLMECEIGKFPNFQAVSNTPMERPFR